MIILIDVDDVLFNTSELKAKLTEMAEERGCDVDELRTPEVLQEIHEADPTFLPGLVYPNAKEFIAYAKEEGYECRLLSSAKSSKSDESATSEQMSFQKLKIKLSGLEDMVGGEVFVDVVADEKSEKLYEYKNRAAYFIDNDKNHLQSADDLGIPTVHMVRGEFTEVTPEATPEYFLNAEFKVRNFAEFIEQLKTDNESE